MNVAAPAAGNCKAAMLALSRYATSAATASCSHHSVLKRQLQSEGEDELPKCAALLRIHRTLRLDKGSATQRCDDSQ